MTDFDDVRAPHDDTPATSTDQPDVAGTEDDDARPPGPREQAGVAEGTSTAVTPAAGTSEAMAPAEGIHQPDVGPGGEQFDTDERPAPNRTTGSR